VLGSHVNEFAFRLNDGSVKRLGIKRIYSFVDAAADRRIN